MLHSGVVTLAVVRSARTGLQPRRVDDSPTMRADRSDRLRLVPIVLLTANLDVAMRASGLAAGATAFLSKPVSSAKLRECVDELLA